jgi:hypothetical protein
MKSFMNLLPLAGLTLVACGTVTPMEGEWTSTSITVNEDACEYMVNEDGSPVDDDSLAVDMSLNEDGTVMTFDLGDGATVDCALEKGEFDCTSMDQNMDLNEQGMDAVLTISQMFSGSFSDEHNGTLNLVINATCEGSACDAVAAGAELTLPCTTDVTASIAHAM